MNKPHKDYDQRGLAIFLIIRSNFNKNMIFVIIMMRSIEIYMKN